MNIRVQVRQPEQEAYFDSPYTNQVITDLIWKSRGIAYVVSTMTFTHNPEYPTPALHILAPNPGIRFTVTDTDGNVLYTNVKSKEKE